MVIKKRIDKTNKKFIILDNVFEENLVNKQKIDKNLDLNNSSSEEDEAENSFENSEESISSAFEEDNDGNNQLNSSNDDKSFYRDFTMKFNISNVNEPIEDFKMKIFQNEEDFLAKKKTSKHVNLTCFVNSIEFHIALLSTMQKICLYINDLNENSRMKILTFSELMKLNSVTYIYSLELEKNISFKILISKIFYLNY